MGIYSTIVKGFIDANTVETVQIIEKSHLLLICGYDWLRAIKTNTISVGYAFLMYFNKVMYKNTKLESNDHRFCLIKCGIQPQIHTFLRNNKETWNLPVQL